jgi:hypothetical protein
MSPDTHFVYHKEKTATITPKIFRAAVQHLVTGVIRPPGFVHPCGTFEKE